MVTTASPRLLTTTFNIFTTCLATATRAPFCKLPMAHHVATGLAVLPKLAATSAAYGTRNTVTLVLFHYLDPQNVAVAAIRTFLAKRPGRPLTAF